MLVLPILAGAGLLGLLMAGGKKEVAPGIREGEITSTGDIATPKAAKEKAVKEVVAGVKAKDWQKAVAAALSSGSLKAVQEVVKALRKAGKKNEAGALLLAFKELQDAAKAKTKSKPKATVKPVSKPVAKLPAKPRALPSKSVAKPKPKAKPKKSTTKKVVKLSPAKQLAKDVTEMLLRSSRYKEDQALVERYQSENGQGSDGKYGPGTARSLWDKYEIVPANPYYFSSVQSKAHQQAADYKRWLMALADTLYSQGRTTEAALADKRAETVGL